MATKKQGYPWCSVMVRNPSAVQFRHQFSFVVSTTSPKTLRENFSLSDFKTVQDQNYSYFLFPFPFNQLLQLIVYSINARITSLHCTLHIELESKLTITEIKLLFCLISRCHLSLKLYLFSVFIDYKANGVHALNTF